MLHNIEYVSNLIYNTLNVPITFYNSHLQKEYQLPSVLSSNPISDENHIDIHMYNLQDDPPYIPCLRTTYLENILTIKVGESDQLEGVWVIGPSIYEPTTEEVIQRIINDHHIKKSRDIVFSHYHRLPVISKMELLNIGLLAYYLIKKEKLDVAAIVQKETEYIDTNGLDQQVALAVSQTRQEISFHMSYKSEKALLQCVKNGDKNALLKQLNVPSPSHMKLGVLSTSSQQRNEKNIAIAAITLGTRYAIEGGLHPELAYTLSDLYIQKLEKLNDITEIKQTSNNCLFDFCDRVSIQKNQYYSKAVLECQSYIFINLYEEIDFAELANIVQMHQNSLSALFKKEVGMSIRQYILSQKVEEAKKLITDSHYKLSEIYTWLNFHDQSHFTKVFKRYAGVTPKEYRSVGGSDW